MEFFAGAGLGFLVSQVIRLFEQKGRDKLIQHLTGLVVVSQSHKPLETGEAIASLELQRVLNDTIGRPKASTPGAQETSNIKSVSIESTDFEIPADSPLNRWA